MDFIKEPMAIENRSMELIAPHLAELGLDEAATKVYSRLIHASGDVGYAPIIRVHPEAIAVAMDALRKGAHIYTDVEMVRTGINKKKLASFGGEVHCLVADPDVAVRAKQEGITRSMIAMRQFGKDLNGSIVAIGNAPTALFEVLRMVEEEGIRPAAIVGIPVGFVGAAESKDALVADDSGVEYITVLGRRGGSAMAVAAVNAMASRAETTNDR